MKKKKKNGALDDKNIEYKSKAVENTSVEQYLENANYIWVIRWIILEHWWIENSFNN